MDLLNRPRTKPLCLWLPHKAVHPGLQQFADGSISDPNGGEFVPAERHKSLFVGATVVRRPNAAKAPAGKPALERKIGNLPPLGPATGTDDETIRNRARMLKSVDVGQMRAALKRTGQLDNTVFVFTRDEGSKETAARRRAGCHAAGDLRSQSDPQEASGRKLHAALRIL